MIHKAMFSIPFVNQKTTENTRRQLYSLDFKIGVSLQPVFTTVTSSRLENHSRRLLMNNQNNELFLALNVVYAKWNYVGFTNRHLYQRINEHTSSKSSIGKHMQQQHSIGKPNLADNFSVLRKCPEKLDCLIYEMLFDFHLLIYNRRL